MRELTRELVRQAVVLHMSEGGDENQPYTEEVMEILDQVLGLDENEMLLRVHELNDSHRGWWLIAKREPEEELLTGIITDVEAPESNDDRRNRWNDDRVLAVDGKIHRLRVRSIIKIRQGGVN